MIYADINPRMSKACKENTKMYTPLVTFIFSPFLVGIMAVDYESLTLW